MRLRLRMGDGGLRAACAMQLCHAQPGPAPAPTADELWEVLGLLLLRRVAHDLVDAQVAVGAVAEGHRSAGPAQLLRSSTRRWFEGRMQCFGGSGGGGGVICWRASRQIGNFCSST